MAAVPALLVPSAPAPRPPCYRRTLPRDTGGAARSGQRAGKAPHRPRTGVADCSAPGTPRRRVALETASSGAYPARTLDRGCAPVERVTTAVPPAAGRRE